MIHRAYEKTFCTTARASSRAVWCKHESLYEKDGESVNSDPDSKLRVLHPSQVSEKSRVRVPTLVLKKT
jgi:hypothetical protein